MSFNNNNYDSQPSTSLSATDSEAEAGGGGGDMDYWSDTRTTQLSLLGSGDYTNASQYSLPRGFVNTSYDAGEGNREYHTTTPDGSAVSGSGGGTMDVWKRTRENLLSSFGGGEFTNNSSFEIPAGFLNNSYDAGGPDRERFQGVTAKGKVLNADGSPLGGTASIESGGDTSESVETTGSFVVTAPAPDAVEAGSDLDSGSSDFRFSPDIQGLDVFVESIGGLYEGGVIQYGKIEGTVTDYNGDEVANATVEGEGAGTSTNANGVYEFVAPGGTEVALTALEGEAGKTRTPSGGEVITVDWQYSGLTVKASLPDGTGVPNAPVEVDSSEGKKRTDDGGECQYVRIPPDTDVAVTYLESVEQVETSAGEGQNAIANLELGAGVKGFVRSERGNFIEEVDINFDIEGAPISFTRGDGQFALGVLDPDSLTCICAANDRRYTRADETVNLTQGDVVRVDFQLADSRELGNAV